MKQLRFSAVFRGATALCGLLALVLFGCNGFSAVGSLGALAVTALTFFCHFALRLLVGAAVPRRFDYRARWFQVGPREQALYRFLRIKRWKKHIPTYDPRAFSLEENTLAQIVAHMCRAEVVHEVIMVCSFLPLLLSIPFGMFSVFFLTSVAAALADAVFVALQRSNRPRMVRLLEKQQSKAMQRRDP